MFLTLTDEAENASAVENRHYLAKRLARNRKTLAAIHDSINEMSNHADRLMLDIAADEMALAVENSANRLGEIKPLRMEIL